MTMSHKEALESAVDALLAAPLGRDGQMESALRAYLDARGLVMVSKDTVTTAMLKAIYDVEAYSVSDGAIIAMLAAAPDPFKEDGDE